MTTATQKKDSSSKIVEINGAEAHAKVADEDKNEERTHWSYSPLFVFFGAVVSALLIAWVLYLFPMHYIVDRPAPVHPSWFSVLLYVLIFMVMCWPLGWNVQRVRRKHDYYDNPSLLVTTTNHNDS